MRAEPSGGVGPVVFPMLQDLVVLEDSKGKLFVTQAGSTNISEATGPLKKVEKIESILSIDWGPNHCCFVDQKHRVFAFGSNLHGRTGVAPPDPKV